MIRFMIKVIAISSVLCCTTTIDSVFLPISLKCLQWASNLCHLGGTPAKSVTDYKPNFYIPNIEVSIYGK